MAPLPRLRYVLQAPLEVTNSSCGSLPGTLSAVLRDRRNPAKLFALTAGHVLAADQNAENDDHIVFCASGNQTPIFTGRLTDWVPNFSTFKVSGADAAIAEVDARALGDFAARTSEWPQGTGGIGLGSRVVMQALGGNVEGYLSSRVSCRMTLANTDIEYMLTDVWVWDADEDAVPGDSGAPIWNDAEQLVGIHAGIEHGNPRRPLLIPIDRILAHFNAEIVVRGESLRQPSNVRATGVFEGPIDIAAAAPQPLATPVPPDTEVLAMTMWGEARGEGEEGMRAVAYVVLNRAAHHNYWGASVAEVCRKPYQFSCWNLNDPNLDKMRRVTLSDPQFAIAFDIASTLLGRAKGRVQWSQDPTKGATHYHEWSLQPMPRWARGHVPCARIGRHVFYNDIG